MSHADLAPEPGLQRPSRDERPTFEQYVAAHQPALLRTAYLMTGDHAAADDLVQQTWIDVYPRWERIAERPGPYVRTVLARGSVDRWRRRRWRETPSDTAAHAVEPIDRAASAASQRHAERDLLRTALAQLSPQQRAVVVLRYFDDLSERETAECLGIRLGTVKSHARDALRRLRAIVPDLDEPAPARGRRTGDS